MVKALKNLLLQNQERFEDSIYQVCSNDGLRLTLTFLRQAQICAPIHLHGENVETSFSYYILKTYG